MKHTPNSHHGPGCGIFLHLLSDHCSHNGQRKAAKKTPGASLSGNMAHGLFFFASSKELGIPTPPNPCASSPWGMEHMKDEIFFEDNSNHNFTTTHPSNSQYSVCFTPSLGSINHIKDGGKKT